MSIRTVSGVLELPKSYRRVQVIDRGRCRPDQIASPADPEELRQLEHRRKTRIGESQSWIAVVTNRATDQLVIDALRGMDFADLASMTPLQAAVAEATAAPTLPGFGDDFVLGIWNHVRGLPFAVESFVAYCHLDRWPGVAWSKGKPAVLNRMALLRQLMDLVRSAPDDVHAETMAVAERLRTADRGWAFARPVTSFLFPERSDWIEQDVASAESGVLSAADLVPSVATAEQAARVGGLLLAGPRWDWGGDPAVELAFLEVAGAEALPFLLAWHDGQRRTGARLTEPGQKALDLVARVPSEAAMRALVERDDATLDFVAYLYAAAERFPDAALRVLSAMAEPTVASTRVLTTIVAADPDRARAALQELGPQARTRVETLLGPELPKVADVTQLPEFLVRPPWSDPEAKRPKPVVVAGLTPPADVEVVWLPGERERWLGRGAGWEPRQGWPAIAEQIAAWRGGPMNADDPMAPVAIYFAAHASPELVRPMLEDGWLPPLRRFDDRAQAFVARYELLALPAVRAIRGLPAVRGRLLQPFVSAEIAVSMVEGMTRRRSQAHGAALGWLRRHAESATRCLLPTALGKAGQPRRNADAALRWLAAAGTDVAGIATAAHGEAIGVAVKELMSDGGLGTYPRTMPEIPIWAGSSVLPGIRLKDGTTVLPSRAAQTVVEMLRISKPEAPYPGLELVTDLCDAASLGEFVWKLFENWRESGYDDAHRWAFDAMGLLGDDGVVDRLEPMIGPWTTDGLYTLVGDALAVLGMIGGDRALAALHGVVQKGRRKPVRSRAEQRFRDVAASLDLDADDLADRVVPRLGLGEEGTLRLDYGPRFFDVGFDELLRPRVTDEAGAVLRRMPRPAKTDDQERAEAAYQQFADVKKAARTVAVDQIRRLEKAMVTRRRWQPEGFAARMVAHPLLRPLTRRLIWGVYGADGSLAGSFRVAEDLSYADIHDAHYEIPEGATIGVAHPVELGPRALAWSEVFADYEILQPLDQLGRPALELTAAERAARTLDRYEGVVLDPAKVVGLEPRGWYSGPVGDPPVWSRFLRPVGADDRYMVMDISPGLLGGVAAGSGFQTIDRIWLSVAGEDASFSLHAMPLSELGAVPASEILRDLTEVTGR